MTIMVLALLSIIGVAMINLTTTEVMIAGSEVKHRTNFYNTESAVVEGCDQLENEPVANLMDRDRGDSGGTRPDWVRVGLTTTTIGNDALDMEVEGNWDWDDAGNDDTAEESADFPGENYYSAVEEQVWGSMDMTKKDQKRQYLVYGRYESPNGPILIEVGYVKKMY